MMNGEAPDPRRRRRLIGILLILVGLVAVVPAVTKAVLPFVDSFSGPKIAVPGEQSVHLSSGGYDLYERTAGESSLTSIPPTAVTVTASDGTTVLTRGPGNIDGTIEHGSTTYRKAVHFTVPDSGDYDVSVSGVAPGEVMLVRSLASTFRDAVPWIALAIAGAMIVAAGVVLLLVGLLSRSVVPVPGASSSPPGWYADPSQPNALRFWDGRAWTTHTHHPPVGS